MTESQIECFEAVAQFRSFSRAAKQLRISQPAVSHQISKLEQELGFLLLDRTGREITLTNGGSVLLDYFERTHNDFIQTMRSAQELQNIEDGEVRLGFPDGWEFSAFDPILTLFQTDYPRIHIELVNIPMGRMEEALLDNVIDAAITMQYTVHTSREIVNRLLMTVSNVLLYPAQFHVPDGHSITLADFSNSTFYLATADNPQPFQNAVIKECAKYGFTPKMVNCSNLTTALFNVRNNQGVFLCSELVTQNSNPEVYAQLELSDVRQPVLLAWRKDTTSSMVNLFLNETLYRDKIVSNESEAILPQ